MSSHPPLGGRRAKASGRSLTLQLFLFAILPLTILLVVIAFGSLVLHSQAMRDLVAEREARASHAASDAIAEQLRQRGQLIQSLAALAAEASGAITTVDPAAGTVTLDSGQTFALAASVDAASLQVGQQVKITYDEADGKMTATEIAPAQ